MAYVPPLNGGRINASAAGNTAGALTLISTGTMLLAGGNNVTLSQNANSLTISAFNQSVQTQNVHNLVIGGNTTGTTANISSGTLTLAGGNNITLSQAGGNAISVIGGGGGVALYDGAHSITSGTANIVAAGAITASITNQTLSLSVPGTSSVVGSGIVNLSTNGASVTISAPAFSAGISSNSVVTNQLILAAGNNVTLGQSTDATGATVSIGVSNQSNQTLSFSAGSQSTLTATGTFDARSFYLNGVGAAKVGFSQSSVFVSVSNQTVGSQSIGMHTSTAGGGTGGTSGSASGGQIQYNFYAGSNITLSQSVNGASGSMSIYGGAGGAGGGVALYDGANSITSGTARFSNSNGVSFGINGQTITGSVAAQSNQTLGMYVLNNTVTNAQSSTSTLDARSISFTNYGALSAGFSGGTMQLSVPATSNIIGTNGVGISSNGSTISVSIPPTSYWMHNSAAFYSSSSGNMINGTMSIARMLLPNQISFSRVDIPLSVSVSTSGNNSSAGVAQTAYGVIYTRSGSTLNPIVGQSSTTSFSYSSSGGAFVSISGPRVMSFNLATMLTAGEYYFGLQLSTATSAVNTSGTTNLGWSVSPVYGTSNSVAPWTDMNSATNQTVNALLPLQGINSATINNTTITLQQSQITQSGGTSGGLRGNIIVIFRNQ